MKKTFSGTSTYFTYDEAGHLVGEYDGSGNLIQEIVWLEEIPVASIRPDGLGGIGVFYIHTDQLSTPRKLTRPSDNAIVWRLDSDPFGVGTPDQDPDGNTLAVVFNLRFPGQYFDAETGISYNYYRDYDSITGRYVQSDPIGLGGGANTYAYVSSNPAGSMDPLGLAPPRARPINPADPFSVPPLFPPPSAESRRVAGLQLESALKKINEVSMCLSLGICMFNEEEPPARGLPPAGIKPPVEGECDVGPASRPSEQAKGGKSLWDPKGGEWRWYPGDKWHNPHWDHNPHDHPSSPWVNVPHGDLPPVKGK